MLLSWYLTMCPRGLSQKFWYILIIFCIQVKLEIYKKYFFFKQQESQNVEQHKSALKHLKKHTQTLGRGQRSNYWSSMHYRIYRLYFMKSWTDHWSHKTFQSNNIKLLITLLGTMAASAGGGGLPDGLGTGIIIINIIAWHGSMAGEESSGGGS